MKMDLIPVDIIISLLDNHGLCSGEDVFALYFGKIDKYGDYVCASTCPIYASTCFPSTAYKNAIDYLVEHYPVEAYKYFLKEG